MGSSEGPAASTQAELNICMQTPNLTRKDVGEILQSFETIHVQSCDQCQTVCVCIHIYIYIYIYLSVYIYIYIACEAAYLHSSFCCGSSEQNAQYDFYEA